MNRTFSMHRGHECVWLNICVEVINMSITLHLVLLIEHPLNNPWMFTSWLQLYVINVCLCSDYLFVSVPYYFKYV
jgi:hypothetical protein